MENCVEEIHNFDLLNRWKINSWKYRILSLMAHDILAIPLSMVASKSTFSTRGCVLDSRIKISVFTDILVLGFYGFIDIYKLFKI